MIIHWEENPLNTRIILDSRDVETLRLALTIEDLKDRIYSAHFRLEEKNIDEAIRFLDVDSLGDDQIRDRLDKLQSLYLEDLIGQHDGDCTCVPASCPKCHAEELMGVNTIEGLGKHPAAKLHGAFSDGRGINEAIGWLTSYMPERTGSWLNHPEEYFQRHLPRWRQEASIALEWLVKYRDDHFPQTPPRPDHIIPRSRNVNRTAGIL